MKIYIHIGTHKTGSTSIQNVLFNNRQKLIDKGFYYPRVVDNHTGQHHLAWMLAENNFDEASSYLKGEVSNAEALGCESIILSSEEFEFLGSSERISFFKNFGEVSIVVMLRRQDDFLEAEYNQSVKMPTVRYSKDIFHFYVEKNFSSRMNYAHILQNWKKVYDESSLQIISYDLARKNGTLLTSFFNFLNLNLDELSIDKLYSANISLPNNALIYLSRLNQRNDVTTPQHLKAIDYLSSKFKGSKDSFIDEELREILFQRYKIMNQNLFHSADMSLIWGREDKRNIINHYENFIPAVYDELLEFLGL